MRRRSRSAAGGLREYVTLHVQLSAALPELDQLSVITWRQTLSGSPSIRSLFTSVAQRSSLIPRSLAT